MQRASFWSSSIVFFLVGCSGATPAPHSQTAEAPSATSAAKSPKVEAEPPVVTLPSGTLAPIDHSEPLTGQLLERCASGDLEFLEVELPDSLTHTIGGATPDTFSDAFWGGASRAAFSTAIATLDSDTAGLGFALFADNDDGTVKGSPPPLPKNRLWLRRTKTDADKPTTAELFVSARGALPGHHFVITIPATDTSAARCKDGQRYGRALRRFLTFRESTPFDAFAIDRLGSFFGKPKASNETPEGPSRDTELVDLMQLFSGADSIEAALQRQKQLHTGLDRGRSTVGIASLAAPRLTRHPWAEMLAALSERAAPEPLASVTPADFYFVRAHNISGLFELLDEGETWLGPIFRLLDESSGDRNLFKRYETELGLKRSAAAKAFGPSLIEEAALVGSDPFLSLGSDLTLLFRVNSETAFNAHLASNLADYESEHGATTQSESHHEGITIELRESADHAVHQYRANVKGSILVSNSLGAIKRVISSALGKAPALANELDFQYMLSRDAKTEDTVLAYMGDRFIERSVSPAVRILSARRLIAQSELRRPGYAALLYGWLNGHEPATLADLTRSKLLQAKDLRHFDAQPIHFELGQSPSSVWGSGVELTPLIDLPTLTKVTPREREAYERFRSDYENLWSEAVDPIALRFQLNKANDTTAVNVKLRILPLVRQREYRDVQELVGDVRLTPGKVQQGIRALFGIASDSNLRRELTGTSQSFLGHSFGLNWLGSWGMLGLGDHNVVANAFAETSEVPKPPVLHEKPKDELEALAKLPLYIGFEVKSGAGAALALTVIREKLADSSLSWQADQEYRTFKIHEVRSNDFKAARLYYVLTGHALYLSLSATMIRQLIDAEVAGQLPSTSSGAEKQGQFAIDFSARSAGGLWTSLIWSLEEAARKQALSGASNAEILFYGAPATRTDEAAFRKLAVNYFGSVPTTPEDRLYRFTKSGATDALRGNGFAPVWPALPIPEAPITRALSELGTLRAQMAFDREPGLTADTGTSLAVSVELTRKRTKP